AEGVVEVTHETLGDLVQRFHDHTVKIPVHRVQAIEVNEQIDRRLAGALGARDAVKNLEPLMGNKGNGNGGNGNGENGNGGGNGYNFGDLCLLESAHIKTS
nr:hypothetical protein [Tanacetum cinerariifolium]